MKLPKAFPRAARGTPTRRSFKTGGFSLLEILISLGIIVIITGLSLFLTMDFYRQYSFRYEENILLSMLERARSRALANINESAHGVCYTNSAVSWHNKYVLFQGASTDCLTNLTNLEPVPASNYAGTGNFSIVFSPLSATTSSTTINFQSNGKLSHIRVNEAGGIDYD